MSFRHGKNTRVLVNASDLSSFFNDAKSNSSVGTSETTCFNTTGGAKTYVVALADSTTSLSGIFDGDAGAVDSILTSLLGSDTDVNVTIAPDNGLTVGSRCIMGQAFVTKYEVSSPVADVVKTSADLQTDAELGRSVVLAGLASISATGTGTAVDNAASTSNGGTAMLHVTANTRNGTNIVKVQHSADNSTWVDLVTFTTVNSTITTSERKTVATGTLVNRYLRAQYTVAGSSGAATITVAFGRRN